MIKAFFINPFSSFPKRNHFFDLLKLFAISLVVLDHALQRWVVGSQNTQLYNFIFLTQMPIFMFVSGFFFYKTVSKCLNSKQYLIVIAKSVISLLVPFTVFSIIKGFFVSNNVSQYFTFLSGCFLHPQNSLWFLLALLWMQTMMSLACLLTYLFKINKSVFQSIILFSLYFVFLSPFVVLTIAHKDYLDAKLIVYYSLYLPNKLFDKRNFIFCK